MRLESKTADLLIPLRGTQHVFSVEITPKDLFCVNTGGGHRDVSLLHRRRFPSNHGSLPACRADFPTNQPWSLVSYRVTSCGQSSKIFCQFVKHTSLGHSNKPCNGHVTDSRTATCAWCSLYVLIPFLRTHRYVHGTLTGHCPQVADRDRQQTKARPLFSCSCLRTHLDQSMNFKSFKISSCR